jgi:hypothetical protein
MSRVYFKNRIFGIREHIEKLTFLSLLHNLSSHPGSGGASGINTQSASEPRALTNAK